MSSEANQQYEVRQISSGGDVDMQISTAHKFPRKIAKFQATAMTYATIDTEVAESCFYVMPGRKSRDGTVGDPIKGPSVRLAEIVASCWGNLRIQTMKIDEGKKFVTIRAQVWDLETNLAASFDVQRKIASKDGTRYSDDMISMTINAAASIAYRMAVFKVVPAALIKCIYDKARGVARGEQSTLIVRRDKMLKMFESKGVTRDQVLNKIGKQKIDDFDLDDLEMMIGIWTLIKDGEQTVDSVFGDGHDDDEEPDIPVMPKTRTAEMVDRLTQNIDPQAEKSHSSGTVSHVGKIDTENGIPGNGDRRVIQTTAVDTTDQPSKPNGNGNGIASEENPTTSYMNECTDYLKAEGIECFDYDPKGSHAQYNLPNGQILVLSVNRPKKKADSCHYVQVVTPDSLALTKMLLEKNRK